MKKFKTLTACATAAFMVCSLAACGSDDEGNGGNVPGPTTPPSGATEFVPEANAGQAAKYNIPSGFQTEATGGNTIESVELLGDGNYIVTFAGATSYAQKKEAPAKISGKKDVLRLLKSHKRATRSYGYDAFHKYGNYIIEADGSIVLNGMDLAMKVAEGASTITFTDRMTGRTSTVTANKEQTATGVNSQKLCRTWWTEAIEVWGIDNGINAIHLRYNVLRDSIESFQLHPYLLEDGITPDDVLGDLYTDMPEEITFSPSGTYSVLWKNGERGYSSWQWQDESRGILFYDWDEDDDEKDSDGFTSVTFSGTRACIAEDYTYEERDEDDGTVYKYRTIGHTTLLAK